MDYRLNSVVIFRCSAGAEPANAPVLDEDYLRRREIAERAAAKHASSPNARRIHQDLAQAYAGLVRGGMHGA